MKRICLISYVFPPVLAAESIVLLKKVRALAQHFALTIVTLENEAGIFPTDPMLVKYVPSNVEVFRIPPIPQPRLVRSVARIAGQLLFRGSTIAQYYDLSWALNATSFIRRELAACRKFDILMTNAQNMCSHVVGHLLQRSLTVPWIQHYSDPIQHVAFRKGHLLAQKLDDWFLRRFLSQASVITVPSREMRKSAYDTFGQAARSELLSKTVVVRHTYDKTLMADAMKLYGDRNSYFGSRDSLNVCYVGNLYGARGAELVINAARRLMCGDGSKEIVTHVFGRVDGKSRRQLEEARGARVRFRGSVSYLESLAIMQHADVLLLVDVPTSRSPFFPSKLADYLGTGRPVVVMADQESAVARIAREMLLALCEFTNEPIRIDGNTREADIERREVFSNGLENYRELITRVDQLA